MFDHAKFKTALTERDESTAIEMIKAAGAHHNDAEHPVSAIMKHGEWTDLLELALETFLHTHDVPGATHGHWTHSLSHFIEGLWERRMDGWIKKFNELAFKGANELHDTMCADRLITDFAKHAKFDDDPAAFGLTAKNLQWLTAEVYCPPYARARLEAGRFLSESAFLCWKLKRPETQMCFDYDVQIEMVDIKKIRTILAKLKELGADTAEFVDLERGLLQQRLGALEVELQKSTQQWYRENLEKAIQRVREELA